VATPVSNIKTLKDFKVELIYSVPGGEQGSWVNLTTDDAGRIYVSDQYGMLYRFKAPAAGQTLSAGDIEKVPAGHPRRERHALCLWRAVCRRE